MSTSSWKKSRLPIQWAEGFQIQGSSPVQEDFFEVNPDRGIFILVDGFGGSSGKKAAEIVAKSVRKFLEQEAGDLDATLPFELRSYFSLAGNVLFNAISYANQKLIQENQSLPLMERGGASLIAGYMEGKLLALANVGACRLNLKRGDLIKEIVSPRSLERQSNPFQEESPFSIPLMSFGTAKQLEPEITEIELQAGDQLCFGTSGFRLAMRDKLFQLKSRNEFSHCIDEMTADSKNVSNASALFVCF
jgi:serine/threonine protein phosphatase PrpC